MRKNNKWRRRIIRLLEDLVKDLQHRPPSPAQAAIFDELAVQDDRADSMFEGVEQMEVTESLYYTKPIEIPDKGGRTLYKLNECLEDTAFATYCFLQDATYLRLFSARAWREFALGKIGIQTATFCTNNADMQIDRLSEKLRKSFSHFNATETTRMHPKLDAFIRQQCGDDARISGSFLDQINPSCEDVSFARHATRRLGFYASTLICSKMTRLLFQTFLSGQVHFTDVEADVSGLLKSLYQLWCLEGLDGVIPSSFKRDCMHYAAKAVVKGHIDSDAVFAAQMLRDIHQQVNPLMIPTEDIIEEISRDFLALYETYGPTWHHKITQVARPERSERMYERYILLHGTVNSPVKVAFQHVLEMKEKEFGRQHTLPDFQLLRHAPSLIGQLATKYRTDFQLDFLDIANDFGHILTAIHLYNAARSSGALQARRWEDMEWVMDRQDHHSIFAGEQPTTGNEYVRRFCLAYGLDSAKFAADRKLQAMEEVKDDIHLKGRCPQRLESPSQLVRSCSTSSKHGASDSSVYQSNLKMLEEIADAQLNSSSHYGIPNKIGILIAAKETFENDEEAQSFDIFNLHLICAKLLDGIRNLCLKEAPDDYPAIRFKRASSTNAVLAELLRDLTDSPRHHERMWPKAVKLLSKFIDKQGSVCINMAFERMKMTTLDSISMDSDASSSTSHSILEAATDTPLGSDASVDGNGRVGSISPTLSTQNDGMSDHTDQDSQDMPAAPLSQQQLRIYLKTGLMVETEGVDRQKQECLLELANNTIQKQADGTSLVIDRDGTLLDTWSLSDADRHKEEYITYTRIIADRLTTSRCFVRTQGLIRDCQLGTMNLEVLANGDLKFYLDSTPKVLVTLPDIAIHRLD